jgi:DnaJ domain/X-domain of DnaJ-containing
MLERAHTSSGGVCIRRFAFLAIFLLLRISTSGARRADSLPDISSIHLQMHKMYATNPPHDTKLYEILQIPSNATAAQISKSYRKLSRQYHPDKGNQPAKLQELQDAYEILKNDATRLPYHQYGLSDPNVAVAVLLGPHQQQSQHLLLDNAHRELLELMGYEYFSSEYTTHESLALDAKSRREKRIRFVAARLVERLRPLVEGSVSPHLVAHRLAYECDQWKRLPMGAQVIRCVGRAYRHAGRDYVQHKKNQANLLDHYSVPVRQQWRKAKAFWTAFLAAGRAAVTEQAVYRQEQRHKQTKENGKKDASSEIEYYTQGLNTFQNDADDDAMFSDTSENDGEEDRKFTERLRAKQTMLTSLQIEALWKVAKIDLDKVILAACRRVLSQQYFFFPSHQVIDVQNGASSHGWVTSAGRVMDANEALQRTAEALILFGDIMVERSKVETAWKE